MRLKRFLPLGLLLLFFCLPAGSVPISYPGQGPTGSTSTTVSVLTTSTAVTLTAASPTITIINTSANPVYFSETSPATASNASIPASGGIYYYQGVPLTVFYLIAPAGSSTVSVIAH
jgi:hypothetical protein